LIDAVLLRSLPIHNPQELAELRILGGMTPERLMAMLSGFFGLLAALLAMVELYGVISYIVARRRNEIGIRIALGARRRQVIVMIMRDAGYLLWQAGRPTRFCSG
jgi:ABC-type antimicrobial peptide transport system permease subunit